MRTINAFFSLTLLLISTVSFSQNLEKNSNQLGKKNLIGIQYNPLYADDWTHIANLFSMRYGYKIAKPFTIGTELSGYFYQNNLITSGQYPDPAFSAKDYYGISTNLFLRYSIRSDKRIQGFLEVSPYTKFTFREPMNYQYVDLYIYVAPGLSLFSKNRRFSMDLYYIYSTEAFVGIQHGQLSYKLNFHF
jgi:hypothetical protein